MTETDDEVSSLGERLQEPYRVNVLEEETLREVRSFYVTPLKVYLLSLSLLFIIGVIVVAIIFYTPIRRLVPGFGDIKENRQFVELTKQVNTLERELETQQTYTRGLMNMLMGGDQSQLVNERISQLDLARVDSLSQSTVNRNSVTRNLEQLVLVPPLRGSVSADYDLASGHLGVDILAPKDSPVVATSDGVIIQADWTLETGNTIAIQHSGNLISFYKHNSALLKKTGEIVTAGEAIAIIGNSGTLSDGPHLHFEVWYNGHAVDPGSLINF